MDLKVDDYIKKQKAPQKEICKKLRELIFFTIPNVSEIMKWGVPTYADGKYYIVALKDHVNLGFSIKELSKKEQRYFEGSGKTMKHITINSLEEIQEEKIIKLITLVYNT